MSWRIQKRMNGWVVLFVLFGGPLIILWENGGQIMMLLKLGRGCIADVVLHKGEFSEILLVKFCLEAFFCFFSAKFLWVTLVQYLFVSLFPEPRKQAEHL